jgi:lysophospholipase L1-like esterase
MFTGPVRHRFKCKNERGYGHMMGMHAVKYGLLPLWIAQGLYVRRTVAMLPEAGGARIGRRGHGPLLRLMVVGDSAAAGVGVGDQAEALLGRTITALECDYTIDWTLIAKTGATAADTLKRLHTTPAAPWDVVVTSIGVNDVTANRSAAAFDADMNDIIELLQSKFAAKLVIVSGFPPVGQFPALPQPLRWFLGSLCRRRDDALRARVEATPGCRYLYIGSMDDRSWIAADGFHPGAPVYAEWARRAAALITAEAALRPIAGTMTAQNAPPPKTLARN